MILGLFGFLILLSIIFVVIGIFKHEESLFALIGFAFLFILSFVLISGNLEVEVGSNATTTYSYNVNGTLQSSSLNIDYSFEEWDDSISHQIGFWLAILSAVGFFMIFYSARRGNKDG